MNESIVPTSYVDAFGEHRSIDPGARAYVLDAMGLDRDEVDEGSPHVAVAARGGPLPSAGELVLEDGTALGRLRAMPSDAPHGYHHLHRDDGIDQLLITGPGRCYLPAHLREWGWAVQLAATRSARSWGIGDLDDLRRLAEWSAGVGAGFMGVSPLGAPNPGPHPEPSPYYPSTRRFGNPLYISIDALAAGEFADLVGAARGLNSERRIDRRRVLELKREALQLVWTGGRFARTAFEAWRGEQGPSLEQWATFTVLTERFGAGWKSWPAQYPDSLGGDVAAVKAEASDEVAFHAWLQWCFDQQLAAASAPLRRIADMPVGVDPGGFDAWEWQEQLAIGASVGAPPDLFNTAGQDWGLPPFIPQRLRAAHYRPFIETIRAQLRHAGGLRIDHVLGLFRLWWVPAGADPMQGAYVRYPTNELLEIVAIESERAKAVIIGEDLGTVPPGVRQELRRRRILSTRLVLFERTPPSGYPRNALAAVTTHDLPTITGIIDGGDLDDQRFAGLVPDEAGLAKLRKRLIRVSAARPDASVAEVSAATHQQLAESPSILVAATLEDALGVRERPNLPGTVSSQRDNWSLALPVPVEELPRHLRVRRIVEVLQR